MVSGKQMLRCCGHRLGMEKRDGAAAERNQARARALVGHQTVSQSGLMMSGAGSRSRRAYDTFTRYAASFIYSATAPGLPRPSQARRTVECRRRNPPPTATLCISSRATSNPLCSIYTSSSSALIRTQIGSLKTEHCFHRRLHNTFGTSSCVTEPLHTIAPTLLVLFRRIYSATI